MLRVKIQQIQVIMKTYNTITNRCLRISSHRSTMFNNRASRGCEFCAISLKRPQNPPSLKTLSFTKPAENLSEQQNLKVPDPKVNKKKTDLHLFFSGPVSDRSGRRQEWVIRRKLDRVKGILEKILKYRELNKNRLKTSFSERPL